MIPVVSYLDVMASRDDLDTFIDELARDDPDIRVRVIAALKRREFARQITDTREP